MDNETIKRARQADLAKYLLSVGVPLVRNGSRYKHREHDSLVFTKNAYYWNSCGEHGNSVDYLVRHMNMGFIAAVNALVSASKIEPTHTAADSFKLDETALNPDRTKSKTYLNKSRFIGNNIIEYLVEKKLLFQEKQTNNAFFAIRDEDDKCVGAELQGTSKKRFKGIKADSKHGYGFNVRFSDDKTYDYALFFESVVDLLSFIDYKINYENKSLKRCILISMSGLKSSIVKHSLKAFNGEMKAVLCVDNDTAGQAFKNEIKRTGIDYLDHPPDKKYKDWNEQLIDSKRRNKPINRLLNRSLADSQEQLPYAEPQRENQLQ